MADRALVFEGAQIGVETVYGTSVAANKKLQAMDITLSPAGEVDVYGPQGQKYDTLSILNREWATGDVGGRPSYTELQYPLSSVLTTAVITTPAGGTLSRDWDWTPANTAPDTPKSFTVERGQPGAGLADKVTGFVLTELGFTFSRTGGVDMSGTGIARALQTGQTLTSSPTALALTPVAPGQVSVYVDDTFAALGTTKLLRDFSAEFRIGDRFAPVWPLNAALTSFDAVIETKPTTSLALTLGNDTVGQGYLATMRGGAKKYVRIEAVGPIIETTIPYLFRIDACVVVADAPSGGDVDGLSTLDWTFTPIYDATMGAAFTVKLRNTATAL